MMTGPVTMYVLGPSASGKTTLLQQLCMLCENGTLSTHPKHEPPTKGQEIYSLSVPAPPPAMFTKANTRTVDMRELGGEMAPMWEKFIQSRLLTTKGDSSRKYALVFVVDALAPHLLPLISVIWGRLKGPGGLCRDWPTAVLLNKVAACNAMTEEELTFFLPIDDAEKVNVMCVDSWNGVGLGDVMQWIAQVAFPR